VATNHRAMATVAMWLDMPCPQKRSRNTTGTSIQAAVAPAMARQAAAKSGSTISDSARTRITSVACPAQIIATAEAKVPAA